MIEFIKILLFFIVYWCSLVYYKTNINNTILIVWLSIFVLWFDTIYTIKNIIDLYLQNNPSIFLILFYIVAICSVYK